MADTPEQPPSEHADKFAWKPGDVRWIKRSKPLPEGERMHPDAERVEENAVEAEREAQSE